MEKFYQFEQLAMKFMEIATDGEYGVYREEYAELCKEQLKKWLVLYTLINNGKGYLAKSYAQEKVKLIADCKLAQTILDSEKQQFFETIIRKL